MSLCFILSLSVFLSDLLSLARTWSRSLSLSHSHSRWHTCGWVEACRMQDPSLAFSLSLSLSLSLFVCLSLSLSLSIYFSFFLSLLHI